jgi:Domain of unknown function (DUF4105)
VEDRVGKAVVTALLGLFASASVIASASASTAPSISPSSPGTELTIYLVTMGPGKEVWERFGHNAIWVRDSLRGTSIAYNYGLFSFRQQNFLLRFIQGRMLYWMQGFEAEPYFDLYVRADRSVWVQELDLPPAARAALAEFLEWNARPENRFYRYDYYRDNCSTRVRDALDRVLGGRIRQATDRIPTPHTYRWQTARLTATDLPVYTGLLYALGPGADRPLSAWEDMFLPIELQRHLRSITVATSDGGMGPLVKSERTLYLSREYPDPPAPPNWLLGFAAAGLALGAALVVLGRSRPAGGTSRVLFLVLAGLWTLVSGIAGLILTGFWAFTDHRIAYRNENLLQANLLSLVLFFLIPAALWRARWAGRPAGWVAVCLAGLSLLGLALTLIPGLSQMNGEIVALALPANVGLALGLVAWAGVGD